MEVKIDQGVIDQGVKEHVLLILSEDKEIEDKIVKALEPAIRTAAQSMVMGLLLGDPTIRGRHIYSDEVPAAWEEARMILRGDEPQKEDHDDHEEDQPTEPKEE